MLTALTFAAALVVGLVITPVVRGVAHRYGLLDYPGGRKVHQVPVPRLGGIGMAIAFGVAIGLASLVSPNLGETEGLRPNRAPAILAGVALLLVVGVIDDTRGMRAVVKLGLQVAAATLAWWLGLSVDALFGPWGVVYIGWLSLPVTVAWVVGVINAVNLIDGLDGLASAVVLTVLAAFGLLAAADGVDPTLPIIAATGGAAFGFLAYNLHPASIIMGDTGSMFLGFVVAAVGISLTQDGLSPASPWIPMIALGVPILDTIWAIVRRAARGDAVFRADRGHIHHQLLRRGLSQRDAMLVLTAISAALATLAVVVAQLTGR
ncbi:MAG: undecaprenyl/decaprenyl-phosphate alpha-N-acetylglucosaminyl 1-phosphate transferase [Chloroflexi bacterium]|nr:undecaprenyl/decaprenyl-phosphate alpha-N-acetylglucosaminyl 1-phosphate transferase [Chloroflexota bacterium]